MTVGSRAWTPDWVQTDLLKHITGKQAFSTPSSLYLALGTAQPDETDKEEWSNELSGGGYQRKTLELTAPKTSDPSGNGAQLYTTLRNRCPIFFDQATANWSGFRYFAIFSAQTGGNLLYWAEYTAAVEGASAVVIKKGRRLVIQNCALEVHLVKNAISTGPTTEIRWSEYLQKAVLNRLFRNMDFAPPTNYLCLVNNMPGPLQTGSNLSEPASASGYARVSLSSWNDPVVNSVELAEISQASTVSFPTATGSWSVPPYLAVVDAATDGNLLYWQVPGPPSGPIESGDTATVAGVKIQLT